MPKTVGARPTHVPHEDAGKLQQAMHQPGSALRVDAAHIAPSAHDEVRRLAAILQPPIPSSLEEMTERRREFSERLAALLADGVQLDPETDKMPEFVALASH